MGSLWVLRRLSKFHVADLLCMNATSVADDRREILSRIGERLKSERARVGLNQADFGAAGGVSKATQVAYESATTAPDAVYLTRLATQIDVPYVLTGVPSSVHAGVLLDWELMTRIAVQIRGLESKRGVQFSADKFTRLQRILYAASVPTGVVDRGLLDAVCWVSDPAGG